MKKKSVLEDGQDDRYRSEMGLEPPFEAIEPFFYFMGSDKTKGKRTKDGKFVVFAGSQVTVGKLSPRSPDLKKLRKQFANKIDDNGVLKEDILFDSVSYLKAADKAFMFIIGLHHWFGRMGYEEWETSDGRTLLEVCRKDGYDIPSLYQDFDA